jgi:hypothetical protein
MNRRPRPTLLLALLLAALALAGAASEPAWARGRGGHPGHRHYGGARVAVGVIVAAPAFWYFSARPLVPVAAAPAAAPVYIERGDAQAASGQSAGEWWYYCADTRAYYPYVKECASEWQRVAPQPPATR